MFIAGIAFPTILVPFLISIGLLIGNHEFVTIPFLHFVPLIWGFWNIFYFVFLKKVLPGSSTVQLAITGALLGALIAILGVFWLKLPSLLGMPKTLTYQPLAVGPILYIFIWLYIVTPLNNLLRVEEE